MEISKVIVDKMYSSDNFSKWLGIEILDVSKGYCKLKMKVRDEMTNGFGIAHGGICFSIADTALAFAANSHNLKSLSIETSISLIKKVNSGDIIIAETNEISRNNKTAVYAINITNKSDQILASFKGTVFITTKLKLLLSQAVGSPGPEVVW